MAYIFIDESGNFNKGTDGKYFVIGSFTIGDQRRTNKAFRSWTHSRFPKRMRTQSEVKWSATGVSEELRIRTLKYITKLDVRIKYGFLLRKNIPSSFKRKGKIESGALYTNIISEILEMYFPIDDRDIHIFCDSRALKGMSKKEFESSIIAHLLPLCPTNTLLSVEMIDSKTNANIQIADWISGALARYFEGTSLGCEYYKILKNNFLGDGKEFFSE